MTYDPSGDAASTSTPITAGTVQDWFLTGNNAVYVGLVVAALFVFSSMGKR
jgi:hypothetical protein